MRFVCREVRNKKMDEIRIYHSIWRNVISMLVCLAFAVGGAFLIANGKNTFIAWTATIFFGLGVLVFLYLLVWERISHTPYLVITDKSVVMNSGFKSYEIPFADVGDFFFIDSFGNKIIGFRYKKEVEAKQNAEATAVGRTVRKINKFAAGAPGAIPASDLTLRPNAILELLNERLTATSSSPSTEA